MADLGTENPATTDEFRACLAAQDVELPLRLSDEDLGVILDAKGRDIFVVDVNSERDDIQVKLIAQWLTLAVNICGNSNKAMLPYVAAEARTTVPDRPAIGWALINAAGHIVIWNTARDVVEQARERRYPEMSVEPLYTHPAAMAALYAVQAEGPAAPSSEADRREA